jgi:hypothetical protein
LSQSGNIFTLGSGGNGGTGAGEPGTSGLAENIYSP